MKEPALRVDIASVFTGAKAFKDADKATMGLTKSVNVLAKSYVGLFSVQRLGRAGYNAVKAFAEDDKAARVLGQTLNNLGLGFGENAQVVNKYISNLEKQTGVLDDELRPAMDRLLRATGSITRSQKLLNLALDISAGTGKSLSQVAQSLQKAYLGQTQSLGRLGVGLSKAELSTASFEEIQTRLAVLFEGQAAMAAETYIGKMNKLAVATNNAKETIGSGLVDALAKVGGGSTVDDAVNNLDSIARGINAVTNAAATAIGLVVKLGRGIEYLTTFGGITGSNGKLVQYDSKMRAKEEQRLAILTHSGRSASPAGTAQRNKQQKAAEDAATKRAKELAALTKKQTAAIKEQTAIQKAGTLFDLQQTQIIAALKGDISAEERKRLELQLAILTGNTSEASKLAGELAKSQGLSQQLAAYLASLPDAKNPFSAWKSYLDMIESQVARIAAGNVSTTPTSMAAGYGATGQQYSLPSGTQFTSAGGVEVTVNVDAGTVIAQEGLVDVIRDSLLNDSLQAKFAAIYRQGGLGSFG
jgi:hypothetical protein